MPDTSGPAFSTFNSEGVVTGPGVSRRLWLMAHAPSPPDEWVTGQLGRHQATEGRARAVDRAAIADMARRGEPLPDPRLRVVAPTELELDIRWRLQWADRALQLNSE